MRKRAALISVLALTVLPTAACAEVLPFRDAQAQIRVATANWAALMDGRARVGDCTRVRSEMVRCQVWITGRGGRCHARVSVSRGRNVDTLRARAVRCTTP